MTGGAFSEAARAAIYEVGNGRCIGCGRTDLSAQHRRGRGMGGTSNPGIAIAANGIPLCGDGVRGCHGWCEANPEWAELLGWRLAPGTDPVGAPFWTRFGWRAWAVEDGFPYVVFVDDDDLDRRPMRTLAVETCRADVGRRDAATQKWLDNRR